MQSTSWICIVLKSYNSYENKSTRYTLFEINGSFETVMFPCLDILKRMYCQNETRWYGNNINWFRAINIAEVFPLFIFSWTTKFKICQVNSLLLISKIESKKYDIYVKLFWLIFHDFTFNEPFERHFILNNFVNFPRHI